MKEVDLIYFNDMVWSDETPLFCDGAIQIIEFLKS